MNKEQKTWVKMSNTMQQFANHFEIFDISNSVKLS